MITLKKQIIKEIKEDYFLIEKEHLLNFILAISISILIGTFLYGVYSGTLIYGTSMKQQGRNELMNEIFEGYDNLPCGGEFKLVNISLEDKKEIKIKKEGCIEMQGAGILDYELVPYYKNLSFGGFK